MSTYTYSHPRPSVASDVIILNSDNEILLIKRKKWPYEGSWALPGGFMGVRETAREAGKRELQEETGLQVDDLHFMDVFDDVDRDPRGRVISMTFYGAIDTDGREAKAGDDASDCKWFPIEQVFSQMVNMAFDHYRSVAQFYTNIYLRWS